MRVCPCVSVHACLPMRVCPRVSAHACLPMRICRCCSFPGDSSWPPAQLPTPPLPASPRHGRPFLPRCPQLRPRPRPCLPPCRIQLAAAAASLAEAAIERIDLRSHSATHPRLGAADHISVHPLQGRGSGGGSPPLIHVLSCFKVT